jgi:3',5'-cyclic AMP phosphodiesterase CpdA
MSVDFEKPLTRLLVVSDIHAFSSKDKAADSVLDLSASGSTASNPLADLLADARAGRFQCDVLVCAGDVCNRADAGGLTRAWSHLHDLRRELGATELIATCGNHDLDSRYLSGVPDPDPKGALLALDPGFPFSDEVRANKFWARNYAVVTLGDMVLVNVNTSAYHGGVQAEIDYGRISKKTVAAIRAELAQLPTARAYVLLCHHHPLPLSGWGLEADSEFLKNGQELLDTLVGATKTTWLVVHGHRHKPRLMQGASNSSAAPFVLGAGSLGARVPGVPNPILFA